jgi:hypothetical protein
MSAPTSRTGARLIAASQRDPSLAALRDAVLIAAGTALTPAEGYASVLARCAPGDVEAVLGVEMAVLALAANAEPWGPNLERSIRGAFGSAAGVDFMWRRVDAVLGEAS